MKQSRKEFIIEAHKHACNEWKNKISDEFPELFKLKPLEVGKWYRRHDGNLWFLTEIKEFCAFGYGFCADKSWAYLSQGFNYSIKLTPATDKEVETALIKEAKKRGFKKGVYCRFSNYNNRFLKTNIIEFNNNNQGLYLTVKTDDVDVRDIIFSNGQWVSIIETITKEQAEKELGKTIIN